MKLTEYVTKHSGHYGRPWTSPRQQAILKHLEDGPSTTYDLAEKIGVRVEDIQNSMGRLKRRGKVEKTLALHVRQKPVASGWLWSLVR